MFDESQEDGPEVSVIFGTCPLPGRTPRLAREGGGIARSVVGPAGESQGVGPPAEPCEPVPLTVSHNVGWLYFLDPSLIDVALWDQAGLDQAPQPLGHERVALVVIHLTHTTPP